MGRYVISNPRKLIRDVEEIFTLRGGEDVVASIVEVPCSTALGERRVEDSWMPHSERKERRCLGSITRWDACSTTLHGRRVVEGSICSKARAICAARGSVLGAGPGTPSAKQARGSRVGGRVPSLPVLSHGTVGDSVVAGWSESGIGGRHWLFMRALTHSWLSATWRVAGLCRLAAGRGGANW